MFPTFRYELSKEWQDRFQSTSLFNEYAKEKKIEIKESNINGARIPASVTKDFYFENVRFSDFGGKESKWENGEFTDSEFDDFSFYNAHLKNVTFRNSKFTTAYFTGATLENVKFIDCKISESYFYKLRNSDIEFINSRIEKNSHWFSESQVNLRFINSKIIETDFLSLKEGSSIYLERSENIESGYQGSNLKYFKVVNSKIINTTAADSVINEMTFENSTIDMSFGDAQISNIIVDNSKIMVLGAGGVKGNTIELKNCKDTADTTFFDAVVSDLKISNCKFSELYFSYSNIKQLNLENLEISQTDFTEANINNFSMKNVTFVEKAEFTDFKPGNTTLENIKKSDNLELITDGSTIKF